MRARRLEPVLRRALRGPCALPPGNRLLVAVSGGADSVALLVGLRGVAAEFGLALHAAHLHHGLRGAEADADLEFVRALCTRLGVPLAAARWDTRARMKRRGLSGENGLRILRREFLRAAAARANAAAIATAHTADDQLETVLLRLLRGAGLPGLGGMGARRGVWLKPLLEATRADVEADLGALGQPWREDATNREPLFARNRIRHDAIPALLRALDPGLDPARARAALARRVTAAAREARDAGRALRMWIHGRARAWRVRRDAIELDSAAVRFYPVAARRTVLREVWKRLAPAGPGLTHRHLAALTSQIAASRTGWRVALPGGVCAASDRGMVRFERSPTSGAPRGFLHEAAAHQGAESPPAGSHRRRRDSSGDRSSTLRPRPAPGRHPKAPRVLAESHD